MSVAITNLQRAQKVDTRLLKRITTALLMELKVTKAELNVCLVNALEMTRLNETFLRHAGSTDVITFDYRIDGPPSSGRVRPKHIEAKPGRLRLHGEIFVCVDEALLQAPRFGTSWQSELVRYVVHGVLHLLGFDDARVPDRRKMKLEENRLLGGLSRRFSLAQLSRTARMAT